MLNKQGEIRKLLGDRYHLHVSWEEDKIEWTLYKKYENGDNIYYSADNKAIMTSETHTEKELYQFAKSHHKIDLHNSNRKLRLMIFVIVFILCFINFFVKDNFIIDTIIFTADTILLIWMTHEHLIWNKNWKVDMLELKENFKRLRDKNS